MVLCEGTYSVMNHRHVRRWLTIDQTVHHPSGIGEIPKWRGIKDIFGPKGCDVVQSTGT